MRENEVTSLKTDFVRVGNIVYIIQPLLPKENILETYFKEVIVGKSEGEIIEVLGQSIPVKNFVELVTQQILDGVRKLSEANKKYEEVQGADAKMMLAGYVDAKYANYSIHVDRGHLVVKYMDPYPVHLMVFDQHPTEDNGRLPYKLFDTFFWRQGSLDALVHEGMVNRYLRKFRSYSNRESIVKKLASDIIDTLFEGVVGKSHYHTVLKELNEKMSDRYKVLEVVFSAIRETCFQMNMSGDFIRKLEAKAIEYWSSRVKSNMLLHLSLHYTEKAVWTCDKKTKEARSQFTRSLTRSEEELIEWFDELLEDKNSPVSALMDQEWKDKPEFALPLLRGVVETFTAESNYRKFAATIKEVTDKRVKKTNPQPVEQRRNRVKALDQAVVITNVEAPSASVTSMPVVSVVPCDGIRPPSLPPSSYRVSDTRHLRKKLEVAPSVEGMEITSSGGTRGEKHRRPAYGLPLPKGPMQVVEGGALRNDFFLSLQRLRRARGTSTSPQQPAEKVVKKDSEDIWTVVGGLDQYAGALRWQDDYESRLCRMQKRHWLNKMKKSGHGSVLRDCGIVLTRGFMPIEEAVDDTQFFDPNKGYKAKFDPFAESGAIVVGEYPPPRATSCSLINVLQETVSAHWGKADVLYTTSRLDRYCQNINVSKIVSAMPETVKKVFNEGGKTLDVVSKNVVERWLGQWVVASPTELMAYVFSLMDEQNLGGRLWYSSAEEEVILQILSSVLDMDIYILNGGTQSDIPDEERRVIRLRTYEYSQGGLWAVRYVNKLKREVKADTRKCRRHWVWLERTIKNGETSWTFLADSSSPEKGDDITSLVSAEEVVKFMTSSQGMTRLSPVRSHPSAILPDDDTQILNEIESWHRQPTEPWRVTRSPCSSPISTGPGKGLR